MVEYPNNVGNLNPPTKWNTLKEVRAPFEWLFGLCKFSNTSTFDKGDNRPLILIPGYGADKWAMRPMKKLLNSVGYKVYDWGHGRNKGHVKTDTDKLAETTQGIFEKYDNQQVTLIGWSLGGVLAREVARLNPEIVREVITLGTPLIGGPKYTVIANKYAKSMKMDLNNYEEEIHAINSQGLSQPITVIYSKSDGVVGWKASIDSYNDHAKNIEVKGSHLGLTVNSQVWKVIVNTLQNKTL